MIARLKEDMSAAEIDLHPSASRAGVAWRQLLLLGAITCGSVLVHGYHGGAEDAEIYLPGILKRLNPALFPVNDQFFASHAGMTLFPALVADSVRVLHLPAEIVMLLWHLVTIFGLLWACYRIARRSFAEEHAAWCGVALVASLLTIPVAGTALYIMDQYVTTRSFSTAASMLALACLMEKRYRAAAMWLLFTMAVHPLMSLFVLVLAAMLLLVDSLERTGAVIYGMFPLTLFPPVSRAYRAVLRTRPYFLLTNWSWYEWLGMLAPFVVLVALASAVGRRGAGRLAQLLKAAALFEALFLGAALVISMPGALERFSELQPMRCLQLVYILMFLAAGCLLGELLLKRRVWRWLLLFAPICAGMAFAQFSLFPDSRHIELPWERSQNSWVEAFGWIRAHTPQAAYFALDPNYERLPGEDVHGFRAIAQRSMLADNGKDSGAVSMFPALAHQWREQLDAHRNWTRFQRSDFQALKAHYGVNWVVLQQPGIRGLSCPYQNDRVLVCRID